MKTQPRRHISNKYNTYTVVTSPVYIGSKFRLYKNGKITKPAKCRVLQ